MAVAVEFIAAFVVCVTVTAPTRLPIKPFVDVTGPENVVVAMIFPYMQVWRICLHVVSRDYQIHRITPDWYEYNTYCSAMQLESRYAN